MLLYTYLVRMGFIQPIYRLYVEYSYPYIDSTTKNLVFFSLLIELSETFLTLASGQGPWHLGKAIELALDGRML